MGADGSLRNIYLVARHRFFDKSLSEAVSLDFSSVLIIDFPKEQHLPAALFSAKRNLFPAAQQPPAKGVDKACRAVFRCFPPCSRITNWRLTMRKRLELPPATGLQELSIYLRDRPFAAMLITAWAGYTIRVISRMLVHAGQYHRRHSFSPWG